MTYQDIDINVSEDANAMVQVVKNFSSKAMQIFGDNGLAKEYCVEKMFRDARASMIEDGVNEALAIKTTEYL
jgi:alkylation response protein AidB-like acyl-CoA dehydrogenase